MGNSGKKWEIVAKSGEKLEKVGQSGKRWEKVGKIKYKFYNRNMLTDKLADEAPYGYIEVHQLSIGHINLYY